MLRSILRFELTYLSKQWVFIGALALSFGLGFLSLKGAYGSDEVHKNSPHVITVTISLLSLLFLFVSTLFTAAVVLKDSQYHTEPLIYTTSVTKFNYLTGHFLTVLATMFLLLCVAVFGFYLGTLLMPPEALGPNEWRFYLSPLLLLGFPNLFFGVCFLFATAILSRNSKVVYVTGVAMYVLYMTGSFFGNSPLMASSTLRSPQDALTAVLIDPFGLAAVFGESRFWTIDQQNHNVFPLAGTFAWNRLLWLVLSATVLLIAAKRFGFRSSISVTDVPSVKPKRPRRYETLLTNRPASVAPPVAHKLIATAPNGFRYAWQSFASQLKIDSLGLFKSTSFAVMLLLWVFLMGIEAYENIFNGMMGMSWYPNTGVIAEELLSSRPLLIILLFYAAELAWRERSVHIQPLITATPLSNLIFWGAKYAAMALLTAVFISLNIGIGLALQWGTGYTDIEPLTYLSLYYYSGLPLFLWGALALVIHYISPNKYVGMLGSLFVLGIFLSSRRLGIEHYLLRYARTPDLLYSDFNQWGHYAPAFHWYMCYGCAIAGALFFITAGFRQKAGKAWALVCLLAAVLTGSYIYCQTNVRQRYLSSKALTKLKADYEKKYKVYTRLPQPTITALKATVDLLPDERRYTVQGMYQLKNNTSQPITKVLVWLNNESTASRISMPDADQKEHDAEFGHYWLELKQPLLPGRQTTMSFAVHVFKSGFEAFNKENSILPNGSYIELEKYVPHFGYAERMELEEPQERQQQGLGPQTAGISGADDYELIDFEAVVSTAADQQVVTTGVLQKEWTQANRRYFHYKTSQSVNFMFAIASARYQVRKEHYRGIELKICYQSGHDHNVPTMMKAMKDALDTYGKAFGPYQFKQLTLAEIPHYKGSATAYPGVVFCAEDLNFLTDFSNKQKVNYTYATVTHEISHQWWANQLVPQGGDGYKFLTESLAKYSEAILFEKAFGKEMLGRYQAADMNLYFVYRGTQPVELPLCQSGNQQYVHYQKGGLTMYALKELIGEEKLNLALKNLLQKHTYPLPKAVPDDFINELYAQATPEQRPLIDDWLKKVMLYDLKITSAATRPLSGGKYIMTLQINAEKQEIKASGNTATALNEAVDIAVYAPSSNGENDEVLIYRQKHVLTQGRNTLTVVLPQKPTLARLDPYSYVLDANRDDNEKVVKEL